MTGLHRIASCVATMLLSLTIGAAAPGGDDLREVVPPLATSSPCVRFHRGAVSGNQPKIDPALPAIPGGVSGWYVAQWQHHQYLAAGDLVTTGDAVHGSPVWSFATPDGETKLRIRHSTARNTDAYDLFEHGGVLTGGGGSNLFLAASAVPNAMLNQGIELDVDARVTEVAVRYDTATARSTGAVLAMAFIGLGLLERDRSGTQFVFMQVPLTSSRGSTGAPDYVCSLAGGAPRLLYAPPGHDMLPFQTGAQQVFRVDLSNVVAGMLAHPYPCAGAMRPWSMSARELGNWRLMGIYAGLEVENEDHRPGVTFRGPQGDAALGLEFDALSVTAH